MHQSERDRFSSADIVLKTNFFASHANATRSAFQIQTDSQLQCATYNYWNIDTVAEWKSISRLEFEILSRRRELCDLVPSTPRHLALKLQNKEIASHQLGFPGEAENCNAFTSAPAGFGRVYNDARPE